MSGDDKIIAELRLLNTHYDAVLEDMKCLKSIKKDVVELKTEMKEIKKNQRAFWGMYNEFIKYKERQSNIIKRLESQIKKHSNLKESLADYATIRDTYMDIKAQFIKYAVTIAILMLLYGAGLTFLWKMFIP